jgi:tetratricopeptide (TPR) repeat protein
LAAASYNLEKGGFAELKSDLEAARAHATPEERSAVDAEIGALQALADIRAIVDKVDPTALSLAAERVPASSDARLRYGKAALAVAALARGKEVVPAELERVRALVDPLTVRDTRKDLLLAVLNALPPPPPPLPAVVDAGVAVVDAGMVDSDAGSDDQAPETFESLVQRAQRAATLERPAQARELFSRAVKLKPGNVRAWIGLGWAALELDKNAEAQKSFRRALGLDDGSADAHFGLAEALKFAGNKGGALEHYQLYLKVEPNGKDAGVARRAIEALQ